jgi:hypothetical protein
MPAFPALAARYLYDLIGVTFDTETARFKTYGLAGLSAPVTFQAGAFAHFSGTISARCFRFIAALIVLSIASAARRIGSASK